MRRSGNSLCAPSACCGVRRDDQLVVANRVQHDCPLGRSHLARPFRRPLNTRENHTNCIDGRQDSLLVSRRVVNGNDALRKTGRRLDSATPVALMPASPFLGAGCRSTDSRPKTQKRGPTPLRPWPRRPRSRTRRPALAGLIDHDREPPLRAGSDFGCPSWVRPVRIRSSKLASSPCPARNRSQGPRSRRRRVAPWILPHDPTRANAPVSQAGHCRTPRRGLAESQSLGESLVDGARWRELRPGPTPLPSRTESGEMEPYSVSTVRSDDDESIQRVNIASVGANDSNGLSIGSRVPRPRRLPTTTPMCRFGVRSQFLLPEA